MQISLGPIDIRFYSGKGWSSGELAFVTARKAGEATRETALRTSFKSEHLTEIFGEEDPTDTFTAPDGTTYHGRVTPGFDGDAHVITARQVYARKRRADELRKASIEANKAYADAASSNGNGVQQPAAVA